MADEFKSESDITAGPSKFDLMSAVFVSAEQAPYRVKFTIKMRKPKISPTEETIDATICGVAREDGSGESWIVYGETGRGRFRAYFDTRRRIGWLGWLKNG